MNEAAIVLGKAQPKQKEFMLARKKYVAYGGARGGGKSWAVREKAKRLALKWAGIKILIIRQTYTDLRENHILPLRAEIPAAIAAYREIDKSFCFVNGSRIKCSYFATDADANQYQGQEYDVIFLEEATQFSEHVFDVLKACLRGANSFPKRMYLTCNPDGIGFIWVKRLFVSRDFKPNENPDDFMFIQALVDDNQYLMKTNPEYVRQLDSLPDGLRERWRYGSWDVAEGQYFGEFRREIHVCRAFPVPRAWRRYRVFDYGLDMLACLWVAVADTGEIYIYKELCKSDLTISDAAAAIIDMTGADETIYMTLAPPDMWGRSQETGKSKAVLFAEAGLEIDKSSNDREAGWLAVKEFLKTDANGFPKMRFFDNCREVINDLPQLLRDPRHPTDVLTEPHEITHAPDALRYFCVYWIDPPAQDKQTRRRVWRADEIEDWRNARTEEERRYIENKYGGAPPL